MKRVFVDDQPTGGSSGSSDRVGKGDAAANAEFFAMWLRGVVLLTHEERPDRKSVV